PPPPLGPPGPPGFPRRPFFSPSPHSWKHVALEICPSRKRAEEPGRNWGVADQITSPTYQVSHGEPSTVTGVKPTEEKSNSSPLMKSRTLASTGSRQWPAPGS